MKFDELYKKVINASKAFEERQVPIRLDFKIEDLRDALVESNDTIEKLKAENERLKKCEIWMKQHFYCEEVIACESAKNRRLKRALWIARAKRAIEKIAWFKLWNTSISTMDPEDGARQEYDKWKKVLGKFLKKVEEFK